ncbi:MAG TPA: Rad52/Rad22 family DNA repair protein [Longimicrobiales bacterium]|nr:Rad52/Rad22 family DNA repair protein [Longimicrobiales bacterium]
MRAELAAPFGPGDLEWRVQQAGEKNGRVWALIVPYVTNRAIQDRLDEVVGPANWKNTFDAGPGGGILCGLSVKVDGEWVTKWDGAENTDIEAVKGGLSGAMKRAAVQWGIGRYLYRLPESWANVHDQGVLKGQYKNGNGKKYFRYDPPALPTWALPDGVQRSGAAVASSSNTLRIQLAELVEEAKGMGLDEKEARTVGIAEALATENGHPDPHIATGIEKVRAIIESRKNEGATV